MSKKMAEIFYLKQIPLRYFDFRSGLPSFIHNFILVSEVDGGDGSRLGDFCCWLMFCKQVHITDILCHLEQLGHHLIYQFVHHFFSFLFIQMVMCNCCSGCASGLTRLMRHSKMS